ncbi:hypothetical protein RHMOL_Rhmol10G0302200 [Rhododendron molle]|uniref:Uncharacterized protein n=1 Tax=Rhododendron molle TaxID=49168 RepID=A0ACC0M7Y9_RHOML|nr:hypothetical protein RHMOL_Rhmol10G0302200 [Rhododendron molle]
MRELAVFGINHSYREANSCVDALANDSPVSVGDLHIYSYSSSFIATLLYADLIGIAYPRIVNAYFN